MDQAKDPESPPQAQSFASRRRMTVYQTREGRPRWVLHMQAVVWRFLMNLGMFFHRMAPPRPPKPNFSRVIPSTISGRPGQIGLHFYVPRDYETQRRLWKINGHSTGSADGEMHGTMDGALDDVAEEAESGSEGSSRDGVRERNNLRKTNTLSEMGQALRKKSRSTQKWGGYPVVINFHGGGFTLGNSHDDARWCGTVVDECHAVVVSVDYRLAPECPFPTAVEDGADAVIYIHRHAEELGIDPKKIALSGFSSGGNMCFTVPLRLYDEMQGFPRDEQTSRPATSATATTTHPLRAIPSYVSGAIPSASSSTTRIPQPGEASTTELLPLHNSPTKTNTTNTISEHPPTIPPDITLACLIPWYPSLDYTRTRDQRRATCRRADQELSALFTNLFDDSYLHPPHTINLDSPYLSPGVAPTPLLKNALPEEIILHTCEWDMLLSEGEDFRARLTSEELGKKVWYHMVEGVPHGWDKAPNPLKPTPGVREHYLRACKEMRRVFAAGKGEQRPGMERATTKGWPTMAPKESVSVVR